IAATAACGPGDKQNAEAKVGSAFAKLGEEKSVTAALTFDGSADDIYAAMKKEKDFKRSDAQMLADLKLSAGISYDRPFKDLQNNGGKAEAMSFGITAKGTDVLDVRSIGEQFYVRLDVDKLFGMGGDLTSSDKA